MSRRGTTEDVRVHLYKEGFFSRWISRILFVICAVAFFWLGVVVTPLLQSSDHWEGLYQKVAPEWLRVEDEDNETISELKKKQKVLSKRLDVQSKAIGRLRTQRGDSAAPVPARIEEESIKPAF